MSNIFQRILGTTPPEHPVPAKSRREKNAELGGFIAPAFLESIPPDRKDSEMLNATSVGWVYACANAISNEVASTHIKLMRQTADGPVEVVQHELLDLIYRVNPFTTAYDHWYRTQMYLEGAGEAPWYLQRSTPNAKPTSMLLLRPDKLEIKFNDETIIGGYKYQKENGAYIDIDAKDIVFLRNPSVTSHFRGMGTVKAAAIAIDSEEYAEKWNRNFFYNGARVDFVLQTAQKLAETTVARMRKLWDSLFKGVDNAHKMAILEQGLEYKALGMTQKDMDFLEQLRWSRDKIMAIFQVPKSVLGIAEDVNRANAEAGYYVFARYTIKPRIERIIQQLNEFLVPQFGDDLYLDYVDPTPDNLEQRAAYMTVAKEWHTVNELRAIDGLPPVRGGDTILRPFNLVPGFTLEKTLPAKGYVPRTASEKSLSARNGHGKVEAKREALEKALEPLALEALKREVSERKAYKRKTPQKKSENKKELESYLKGDDERDAFQKMLNIKSVAQFEDLMQRQLIASFDQQARIVEENLETQNTVKMPKVRGRKKDPDSPATRAKAEELLRAIWDEDLASLEEVLNNNLSPVMLELVREQALNTSNYLNLNVGDITSDPEVQKQIQALTLKLSGSVDETTRENIRKTLEEGITEGEGITNITARIKTVFDQASQVRSEMIARSESIRASNYAAEEVYRKSGITYKEWITASDERTCPFCGDMDGKRLKVGEDFWKLGQTMSVDGEDLRFNYLDVQGPPLHPNCRCTLGPVIEI